MKKSLFLSIAFVVAGYAYSYSQSAAVSATGAKHDTDQQGKPACCQKGGEAKACCSKDASSAQMKSHCSGSGTTGEAHKHDAAPAGTSDKKTAKKSDGKSTSQK